MKNYGCTFKIKLRFARFVLVLGLFTLVIAPNETDAQRYNRSQKKLFLGLDGGVGIRNFKLRSDIKELNQLNVYEEGFNLGVLFGSKVVQSRARIGIYQSSKTVYQKIDAFEMEAGVNFYPTQIKRTRKPNYFRPYLVATLGRENLSFYGSYELPKPPQPEPKKEESKTCPGQTGGTPPGDPDQTPDGQQELVPDPDEIQTNSGEINKRGQIALSRIDVGGGMMLYIPSHKRMFMNLFAEVKYGLPLGNQSSNYGLARTEVSRQLIVNFGVSIGLKN